MKPTIKSVDVNARLTRFPFKMTWNKDTVNATALNIPLEYAIMKIQEPDRIETEWRRPNSGRCWWC
jgi:hypothetical protein